MSSVLHQRSWVPVPEHLFEWQVGPPIRQHTLVWKRAAWKGARPGLAAESRLIEWLAVIVVRRRMSALKDPAEWKRHRGLREPRARPGCLGSTWTGYRLMAERGSRWIRDWPGHSARVGKATIQAKVQSPGKAAGWDQALRAETRPPLSSARVASLSSLVFGRLQNQLSSQGFPPWLHRSFIRVSEPTGIRVLSTDQHGSLDLSGT